MSELIITFVELNCIHLILLKYITTHKCFSKIYLLICCFQITYKQYFYCGLSSAVIFLVLNSYLPIF